ncbi:cyclin-like protein [Pavlovales sp. CCMP2436]|nr:cyclin-like protein [Pavlovales sp. CCMP2436]
MQPSAATLAAAALQPATPTKPLGAEADAVPASTPSAVSLTPLRGAPPLIGSGVGSTPQLPLHPLAPQSPAASSLELVAWLKTAVEGQRPAIGPPLSRFVAASGDESLGAKVLAQARELTARIPFSGLGAGLSPGSEQQPPGSDARADVAVCLFVKSLGAILQTEEKRLKTSAFAKALLRNESFRGALLLCCAECVAFTHNLAALQFPHLLGALGVEPYSLLKVLDFFVRCEVPPALPPSMRRHLHRIECHCLEALVWRADSNLFALVEAANAAAGQGGQGGGFGAGAHLERQGRAQQAQWQGDRALSLFWEKLLYLAALRLHALCQELRLAQALLLECWRVLKAVLRSHTRLLEGRHLDQISLCTVYGVCKAQASPVTFRRIVEVYKRMPHAAQHLLRNVSMAAVGRPGEQGAGAQAGGAGCEVQGDIIQFYNSLFLPETKLLLLSHGEEARDAALPMGGMGRMEADSMAQSARVPAVPASLPSLHATLSRPLPLPAAHAEGGSEGARSAPQPLRTSSLSPPPVPRKPPDALLAALPLLPDAPPLLLGLRTPEALAGGGVVCEGGGGGGVYAHVRQAAGEVSMGLTPRTRVLYSFGHSPALELAKINRRVNGMAELPPAQHWVGRRGEARLGGYGLGLLGAPDKRELEGEEDEWGDEGKRTCLDMHASANGGSSLGAGAGRGSLLQEGDDEDDDDDEDDEEDADEDRSLVADSEPSDGDDDEFG